MNPLESNLIIWGHMSLLSVPENRVGAIELHLTDWCQMQCNAMKSKPYNHQ